MTLADYLSQQAESGNRFAERIGVPAITVQRYLKGRVPAPRVMEAIYTATNGAVQPNDFYRLVAEAPNG